MSDTQLPEDFVYRIRRLLNSTNYWAQRHAQTAMNNATNYPDVATFHLITGELYA